MADESTFTFYKEMLRDQYTSLECRKDKKYFVSNRLIAREKDFSKKVPSWASDLNLLARVVALQYREARQHCADNDGKVNPLGRPKP